MTSAVTDFTQYADLRYGAENNDRTTLRKVAGQFEALFLESMMKNMREASLGDPIFGGSNEQDMVHGLYDQQLAVEMSSGRGIGLADMLVRQMGGGGSEHSPIDDRFPISETRTAVMGTDKATTPAWKDPISFARDVWPHVKRVAERLNVAPEGVLAQAALETGWGQHVLPAKDGSPSHNLFGIKASSAWQGDSVARKTIEYDHGVARPQRAMFRAYKDVSQTFDDYFSLLTNNPRYLSVRDHGDDVDGFAVALQTSGYATDPAYAKKISRIANSGTMSRVMAGLESTVESSPGD